MPVQPNIFEAQRAPRHRKRQIPSGGASPTLSAHVLSVLVLDATGAVWIFDRPVVVDENQPCPQLRIQTASGWHGAATIANLSPYLVACDYESNDLNPGGGDPWEIVATPVGLSFGSGVSLALPESGTTVR
jgi:hypothetical protein